MEIKKYLYKKINIEDVTLKELKEWAEDLINNYEDGPIIKRESEINNKYNKCVTYELYEKAQILKEVADKYNLKIAFDENWNKELNKEEIDALLEELFNKALKWSKDKK